MHIVSLQLSSLSAYSQSHAIIEEKPKEETHEEFGKRTWRERLHVNQDGYVFIPPMAFKLAIIKAAQLLGIPKKDSRNERYTKHFETEVQIARGLVLPYKQDDPTIIMDEVYAHSQPTKPKAGGRVWRYYPTIPSWEGTLEVYIVGDLIPEPIFLQVLEYAGLAVGIGRWRPENRGVYGQFKVVSHAWKTE